ncbi:MAG: aminotransferase class V-fold PLP-dependent enzyme, partial [Planctomycetota bacterium]
MTDGVIYLDNAATTWPKPPELGHAMTQAIADGLGNPHRSAHRLAMRSQALLDELRDRVATVVGTPDRTRVILTPGCTDAINIAINGVLASEAHRFRPHIVTTTAEHNAVRRAIEWWRVEDRADVVEVCCDADGYVSADDILDATCDRTVLVAMIHASNVTGALQPVEEVTRRLRAKRPNALLHVDAAQTCGCLPMNVHTMDIDLLSIGAHKALLGPTGIGALYVGPRVHDKDSGVNRIEPTRFGGTGDAGRADMPEGLPHRLEPGTPNLIAAAGWLGAMNAMPPADPGRLDHERALCARIICRFIDDPRTRIPGPPASRRTPVVSMDLGPRPADTVATALDASFGICVRAGFHCAPGVHDAMGCVGRPTL